MLDDRLARERPEVVREGLRRRHAGTAAEAALDVWRDMDARRRELAGRRDRLAALIATAQAEPSELAAIQRELAHVTADARATLMRLPNLPDPRVPEGQTGSDNVELRRWGTPPAFGFAPRPHWELGAALGILDTARATRLSGPRFPLLVGHGARLARALAALMLDLHGQRGYVEIAPPHLLRGETLEGTGHLPRYADDLFAVPADGLFLSPTAEAQLVGMHAGETLPVDRLPLAYTACTPAFRREAGSAGHWTRGLLRQHQFDKVELVRIVAPEASDSAFAAIVADAEMVLQTLELPYRVVALCAGELPFSAQRTYDLEVWMPGLGAYIEVSSISDCGPFQARREQLRYRPAGGGRPRFPHTLNGSGLAIGRTLAAVLEHGQRENGTIGLPATLAQYTGYHELVADPAP